jgi:UDPglucose--hexose-1-phosphate uridylyltransferase
MSVIRLQGKDRKQIEEASFEILEKWRKYNDESVGIRSFSFEENDGPRVPHNTITPIARMRGDLYEIDLVLRNNRTDKEHPWGIFHPTADLHHIKKENIGLIEVMGLAILPARLKTELAELEERILNGQDLRGSELTAKHADWAEEWRGNYPGLTKENIHSVVQCEVGKVFAKVLECAGVYKKDEKGRAGFRRFLKALNE